MTLLSLCIKLYMLNVLQFSKFRPLCIAKNQTFPFITRATTSSTSVTNITSTTSTLTTAATTASVVTTTANSGGTATITAGPVTTTASTPTGTTIPPLTTTAGGVTNPPITAGPTTTAGGVTNPPITAGPTTTVATTIINTRIQRRRKSESLTVKRAYEYPSPNCPKPMQDCQENNSNSKCPCFDRRTSKINNQNSQGRSCIGPESDRGICTTIKNCPLIVEEYYAILRKQPKISYEEFLARSKCRETSDKICCPVRK